MEQRIKEYEQFITEAMRRPGERQKLAAYHREMVANFQHERLIHLIIMLFFVVLAISSVIVTLLMSFVCMDIVVLVPLYILTGILFILSLCYIRHYYFLENHIQRLYDYSRAIELSGE